MEIWKKNILIGRIVSGQTRLTINQQTFYIRSPSRLHRCLADEVFEHYLDDVQFEEIFENDDILRVFWSPDLEDKLNRLEADIDNLKVELFKKRFRSNECSKIREALYLSKEEFNKLNLLKHSYDNFSRLGLAQSAKERCLLGYSTFYEDGKPYWTGEASWESPDPFLNKISRILAGKSISVEEFREIARTEPWLTTWNIQKYCQEKIFAGSSFDITEDQKTLIIWSSIYESIREHPDNLTSDVVEDDDMIDGWMIMKRKDRGAGSVAADELSTNKKIRQASEQFYPVDTAEDAVKFMKRTNSEGGLQTINARLAAVKEAGEIAEQNLPDTKVRLQQERHARLMDHLNKTKK